MTIASTLNRVSYTGNGSSTAFAVSFPFHSQADLVVVETIIATGVSTTKTITTHYTISGTTDALGHYSNGGTVNFLAAPASTERVTIYRDPTRTQPLDLQDASSFPAENVEAQFDYVTMLVQRVSDLIGRSARQPDGDSANITVLPSSVDRASKFLAFDGNGDPIAAAGTSANLTPVSTFINTLLDDANAADARTTLGAASATDLDADELILDSLKQAVRNPIINGNMEVWQRGTTFAPATDTGYVTDRWAWRGTGAGVATINRSTNVPTVAQAGVLFNYSLEVDVTTALGAPGTTEIYALDHRIEGYNWRHFAQRQLTLSFWVQSPKSGVHSVGMQNGGADRALVLKYVITTANTWEYKTLTVPASPSTGTWDYTNGIGVAIHFNLATGSNFTSAFPDTWNADARFSSVDQVNVMDNTANFFRITGIKLELGSIATPIQYVPFEEELQRCMRYFQKSFDYATAPAQNAGLGTGEYRFNPAVAGAVSTTYAIPLQTALRTAVLTVTPYNPAAANVQVRNLTDAADFTATASGGGGQKQILITTTGTAGTALGESLAVHWTADAEL